MRYRFLDFGSQLRDLSLHQMGILDLQCFDVPESFPRDLVPPIYLEQGCLADPHLPELAMKQHHPLIQRLGCPALQSVLGHQVFNVLPCKLGIVSIKN